jgi:hypothetical protein
MMSYGHGWLMAQPPRIYFGVPAPILAGANRPAVSARVVPSQLTGLPVKLQEINLFCTLNFAQYVTKN